MSTINRLLYFSVPSLTVIYFILWLFEIESSFLPITFHLPYKASLVKLTDTIYVKGKAAASFLANSSDIVTEFLVGYTLFLLLTLFFINIVVYMIKRAVTNTVKDNVAHIRGETEEMFYGMTGGGNAQQLVNRSLNLAEQRMHQSMDQAEQRMHQATYGLFGTNHDPNRTLGSRLNHLFVKKTKLISETML